MATGEDVKLAIRLLYEADGQAAVSDVELLTAELGGVEYDSRVDDPQVERTVEAIFLGRIGGLGNLRAYLNCISIR